MLKEMKLSEWKITEMKGSEWMVTEITELKGR